MGTAVMPPFPPEHYNDADACEDVSDRGSIASRDRKFQRGESSRLKSLDRYWSERTALISSHHHRELAAAQSAVHQVISQQAKLGEASQQERYRAVHRIEELLMELNHAQQANNALWLQSGQIYASKEVAERRLATAEAEKAAVMAAGEVLLAELEHLGELRDQALDQLADEEKAHKALQHMLALMRAEKADALATATVAAAAKTEALGRLAAAEGVRKAVQRRLTVLHEMAPELATLSVPEEPITDPEAAADVALHQCIMRRSAEVTLETRCAAAALASCAKELRTSEAARIEAERLMSVDRSVKQTLQKQLTALQQEVESLRLEREKAREATRAAVRREEMTTAALVNSRDKQSTSQLQAEQVQPLRERLKAAEAATEAATKRAEQEAEFRVDVAQGLNEELAARDRALRRAALDRTIREAAFATVQRDLEDAETATQEALHISDAERDQWNDQLCRLRNQENSLQKKLKAATLQSRNANRATELSAVMRQVEMQKMECKLRSAVDALQREQLSSEKSRRQDALEIHRLGEQIKGQTQSAIGEATEAAGVVARAETERRRISEKYTRQQQQAHMAINEFKEALAKKQAECQALSAEIAHLRSRGESSFSPSCRQHGGVTVSFPEQPATWSVLPGESHHPQWMASPSKPLSEDSNSMDFRRPAFIGQSRHHSASPPDLRPAQQLHGGSSSGVSRGSSSAVSVEAQLELLQKGRSHSKRSSTRRVAFADFLESSQSQFRHKCLHPGNK